MRLINQLKWICRSTIRQWNVNGWSSAVDHPSSLLREQIVQDLGYDMYSINETFLRGNQQLSVCGYICSWFGSNRHDIDPRAVRGSGGTGFLVKNCI